MSLNEWVFQFAGRRALHGGAVERTPEGAVLVTPGGRHIFTVHETLDSSILANSPKETTTIVCQYSEKNFEFLVSNFDQLSKQQNLSFLFVSEHAQDTWRIKPALHAKFADPATLKQGLRTSFDAVIGKSA